MNSYIENNLMPNESITKKGSVHWIGFVPSAFIIIFRITGVRYKLNARASFNITLKDENNWGQIQIKC